MPEPGTAATAARDGRALAEAITALRRGEPVLIRDDQINVLAVAAELVTEENLQQLRALSQAPARVVLTRRRAVALGLAPRYRIGGRHDGLGLVRIAGGGHPQSGRSREHP